MGLKSLMCLWFAVLTAGAHPAFADEASGTSQTVRFEDDVAPILQRKCLHCHGGDQQEGDLRLDSRAGALKGGHTGGKIVGGDLETNQIYVRVTADDVGLLMPKGEETLSEEEVDVLRRWVLQGAPWPPGALTSREQDGNDVKTYAFSVADFQHWNPADWSDERLRRFHGLIPWLASFLPVLIAMLVAERAREKKGKGDQGRWTERMANIPRSFFLCLVLLIATIWWPCYYQRQARSADARIARLESRIGDLTGRPPIKKGKSDAPPRPVHPRHPPRLGGEYYRGNDERSSRLFNGGFYRTATMRVHLCDDQKRVLQWGSRVENGNLLVRFEIEQAPFAADALFADNIWNQTFLTTVPPKVEAPDFEDRVATFAKVEDGMWRAFYPLKVDLQSPDAQQGVIYLYRGARDNGSIGTEPQYAAEYSLVFRDGVVAAKSQLWMGYIFRTGNVAVRRGRTISEDEWFSFRPIPEITRDQNVTDPKLLGTDDYLDKTGKLKE